MSVLQHFRSASEDSKVFWMGKVGMGASASVARGMTRQELLKSTANPREFTNKLFQILLTKLTPEDFLKLANPKECSTFIFTMANAISKVFDDLKIRPTKDPRTGIILFQKISTLQERTKDSRDLCLVVAYFYIRIFQIFGALALTVLDDPGAGQTIGALRYDEPEQPRPGFFGQRQPQRIPGARGAYLVGGASSEFFQGEKTRKLYPIREIFEKPNLEGSGRKQRYVFPLVGYPDVMWIPNRVEGGKDQNLRQDLGSTRIYANINLSIPTRTSELTKYTVIIGNFRLYESGAQESQIQSANKRIGGYFDKFVISSRDNGSTWYTDNSSLPLPLPDRIVAALEKGRNLIHDLLDNPQKTLKDLAIPKAQLQALGFGDAQPGAAAGQQVYSRDPFASSELENRYLIRTLKAIVGQGGDGQKTVPFCVARALQLLDAEALASPGLKPMKSYICSTKFSLPSSAPTSDQKLSTMEGLKAADQLFKTGIKHDEKGSSKVEVEDMAAYKQFLTTIQGLFGRPGTTTPSRLDDILAKQPPDVCAQLGVKQYLQIQDPADVKKIYGVIRAMYGRQMEHTKAVMKFYQTRLFRIAQIKNPATGQPTQYVEIHPTILKGGIDELAKVSAEARNILIQYYSACEKMYQDGIKMIIAARKTAV
jgi:hypothetical protein